MREPLRSERLILRDVTEADAELLFDLDSDPEVMRYIGPRPASDVGWYRERIRTVFVPLQAHSSHGVRIVLDRASGEFLGSVFICPATASVIAREIGWTRASEQEVGYRYCRSAWGRGIATQAAISLVQIAFDDPAITAVDACAQPDNTASLRVLEKLGLGPWHRASFRCERTDRETDSPESALQTGREFNRARHLVNCSLRRDSTLHRTLKSMPQMNPTSLDAQLPPVLLRRAAGRQPSELAIRSHRLPILKHEHV